MKLEEKHFSNAEAQGYVGKRIRTRVEFSGVPRGTTGVVIRADSAGKSKTFGKEATEVFDLAIQWDLERQDALVDWFTREEYQKFFEEL